MPEVLSHLRYFLGGQRAPPGERLPEHFLHRRAKPHARPSESNLPPTLGISIARSAVSVPPCPSRRVRPAVSTRGTGTPCASRARRKAQPPRPRELLFPGPGIAPLADMRQDEPAQIVAADAEVRAHRGPPNVQLTAQLSN